MIAGDARHFQMASQIGLIVYGIIALDFEIDRTIALVLVSSCVIFQLGFAAVFKSGFDPRSALISSFSLVLLLRTHEPLLAAAAGFVVVSSKFLIRFRGKHLFNPSDLALVVLLLGSDKVWVSAGQWGSSALVAFLAMSLGVLVLYRTRRSDVTVAFLIFYGGMVAARSLYLNEPPRIALHRLESGALILFAFFMISDPRPIPDARIGRIIFAFLVAAGAYFVQFKLFRTNGLLYSLAFFSILTPVIDVIFPGTRYEWTLRPDSHKKDGRPSPYSKKGTAHPAPGTQTA